MWGQHEMDTCFRNFSFLPNYPQPMLKGENSMELNVYEKKQVVKTYKTDVYDLMFGTVEDVADAIKLDELKTGSDVEIMKMIGKLVLTSMDTIKGLLKDIFDGLTDEELKNVKVSEIATVLVDVVKFTVTQLNLGARGKN